jgi:hypothetical protein
MRVVAMLNMEGPGRGLGERDGVCMRVVAMLNMEDFLVIRDLYN